MIQRLTVLLVPRFQSALQCLMCFKSETRNPPKTTNCPFLLFRFVRVYLWPLEELVGAQKTDLFGTGLLLVWETQRSRCPAQSIGADSCIMHRMMGIVHSCNVNVTEALNVIYDLCDSSLTTFRLGGGVAFPKQIKKSKQTIILILWYCCPILKLAADHSLYHFHPKT